MSEGTDERFVDKRSAARVNAENEAAQAGDSPVDGASTSEPVDELAAEREKAENYYRNWQRSAADFANYKRRIEQERGETARLAGAAFVINILPVYDDLDRAVSSVDSTLAGLNWVQGVSAIHQKFGKLLEAMGVKEIEAESKEFDPLAHEAVGRQPGEANKVLHVVQKGYELQGKVIRPAMVIVGEATNE